MAKRRSYRGGDSEGSSRKRQKIIHETPTSEEITTSRQLQQLLSFDQDLRRTRHGLQSFKLFLDFIVKDDTDPSDKLPLLTQYLQSTRPRGADENLLFLPDIIETWNFAAQVDNGEIMSAVPVVLDLLLKVISTRLDLVPHGLGIGKTLLEKRQQELLGRNLSADKVKEFIISPTLRLLRQVMCLDGGALAKQMFRERNQTFRSLARNMGVKYQSGGFEDPTRTSVRTNAVRFFLSALKYLNHEARTELLGQRELVANLTRSVKDDPPYLVVEILDTLKTYVLLDEKLPKESKVKLLNSATLGCIGSLYAYDREIAGPSARQVPDVAHDFLLTACTDPAAGLLRHQSGFYPRGVDRVNQPSSPKTRQEDATYESAVWMDKFKDDIPVCNFVLSDFILTLRPWSNLKQSQLLVAIFSAAPELVAKYFLDKRSFTFEPKLSATWIGYAAFLFSTVRLEIPQYFGHKAGYFHLPPPTNIALDNIIPPPLNRKVFDRLQSAKSSLVVFFATRLLTVCLEKLQAACRTYREASETHGAAWEAARRGLLDESCQRAPDMKEIIRNYRSIPSSDLLHRETATRLLRLYYETIPQLALTAKFDVSPFLASAIDRLRDEQLGAKERALVLMELRNLLQIAQNSPGVRWFSKVEPLSLTPFVAVMKLYDETFAGGSLEELRDVLEFVAQEHQLVAPQSTQGGLSLFIESLQSLAKSDPDTSLTDVWTFLDNCASRCASSPIKYLDTVLDLAGELSDSRSSEVVTEVISPLMMAMVEQLPFLVGSTGAKKTIGPVVKYLAKLAELTSRAQDSMPLVKILLKRMAHCLPKGSTYRSKMVIPRDSGQEGDAVVSSDRPLVPVSSEEPAVEVVDARENSLAEVESMIRSETDLDLDNSALGKWHHKSVDELIGDGYLANLIRLLASEHESIRKEALTSLYKATAKIKQSDHEERDQVWLMLSELTESAREAVASGPLPTPITAFVCHSLEVLRNPLHCLYAKINTFLTRRGPVWSLDKLPLVHEVLDEAPSTDDAYYRGLDWLLAYLYDGLRTAPDVALFHRRRVYERLCALTGNPYLRLPLRAQIFKILYRTTDISAGSTTLVKRFGIVSWLEAQRAAAVGREADMCLVLLRRMWDTCDQEDVLAWSRLGVLTCGGGLVVREQGI